MASLVFACASQDELGNEETEARDLPNSYLAVEELPPMPDYPPARGGRLVTQSVGDFGIQGEWQMTAGFCDEIGVMEIYAGPTGMGTGILIRVPSDERVGTYPVVAASFDLPEAPAALVAVQIFDDPEAYGFQAFDGQLEITAFGEELSGRFATTMREISSDELTHYVGVFEQIPVEPLPDDYCQNLRDSIVPPDSVAAADSTSDEG